MGTPEFPEHVVDIRIPAGTVTLLGTLAVPAAARGLVLFAHGSGSSRFSPRNRAVAHTLRAGGLATLLVDLLTPQEEQVDQITAQLRFDIGLLADRLERIAGWLANQPETQRYRLGLFGASTGAGAALLAAAQRPELVAAVVSRGGRPDLAGDALARVVCPVLLIVGGADTEVIALNRQAYARLDVPKRLDIIPGATHLFEEPGALERVADLALQWFDQYLPTPGAQPAMPEAHPPLT